MSALNDDDVFLMCDTGVSKRRACLTESAWPAALRRPDSQLFNKYAAPTGLRMPLARPSSAPIRVPSTSAA